MALILCSVNSLRSRHISLSSGESVETADITTASSADTGGEFGVNKTLPSWLIMTTRDALNLLE